MSSFEERYSQLNDVLDDTEEDLMKFYEKGNKAAGTRARKSLMELKKLAHEIRQEIQDIKNNEL
jgi:ABC-type Zn uptake system ZnuABC Zn-binding protein ZnuA